METAHTDIGEESEEGVAAMIDGVFKKACNGFDFFGCSQIRVSQKTETGPTPTTHTRTHP